MKIENYREQPAGGNLLAVFDVYLPKIQCLYRNFKLMRGKKGLFVSVPSFRVDRPDGTHEYVPYIQYSGERAKEFYKMIMDELKNSGLVSLEEPKPEAPTEDSSYLPF